MLQLFRAARRCKAAGKLVVFGGPYPTACPDECRDECDVMVLNEGECTWPPFMKDLEAGSVKRVRTIWVLFKVLLPLLVEEIYQQLRRVETHCSKVHFNKRFTLCL